MIQTFLTVKEAAEKLKDRGYTHELIQAAVAAGRIPYHVRDKAVLIPFPEADRFFPPVVTPKPAESEAPAAETRRIRKTRPRCRPRQSPQRARKGPSKQTRHRRFSHDTRS